MRSRAAPLETAAPACGNGDSPGWTDCGRWRWWRYWSSTPTPALLPGGFLGVDLFFVISGYLITRLLLAELAQTGGLDLAGFYLRRAFRLLPAVLVLLVAVTLASVAGLARRAADPARRACCRP